MEYKIKLTVLIVLLHSISELGRDSDRQRTTSLLT